MLPLMDRDDVDAFLALEFPQMRHAGREIIVAEVRSGTAVLRFAPDERDLRPGGTVSGPSLFALADYAAYAVVLAHVGPVALAVTTNMTINFLRRPRPGPLLAEARLLKLGRRLAVSDIAVRPEGDDELAAHAVATYALPHERG